MLLDSAAMICYWRWEDLSEATVLLGLCQLQAAMEPNLNLRRNWECTDILSDLYLNALYPCFYFSSVEGMDSGKSVSAAKDALFNSS